jgi:hypothetical protein
MPAKKLLTKDRAEAVLEEVIANPPHSDIGDNATAFNWERPQYVAWSKVKQTLPADVDQDLLHRALIVSCDISGWDDVDEMPAHCDDAIVRLGEHFEDTQPEWKFIMTALRGGRGERHARLRHLLVFRRWLGWPGQRLRRQIVATIDEMPEIVDGAHAAYAIEEATKCSYYLPILAADGTPDSLDLLLPRFEAAIDDPDEGELDWLRKDVVPLLPDNKYCRAFVERFEATLAARTETSPALDFLRGLGQANPPLVVQFTLTFKDRSGRTTYRVKADSSRSGWLQGHRNEWMRIEPGEIATQVPGDTTRHILRVGIGVDRACVERWAIELLPERVRPTAPKPKKAAKPKKVVKKRS